MGGEGGGARAECSKRAPRHPKASHRLPALPAAYAEVQGTCRDPHCPRAWVSHRQVVAIAVRRKSGPGWGAFLVASVSSDRTRVSPGSPTAGSSRLLPLRWPLLGLGLSGRVSLRGQQGPQRRREGDRRSSESSPSPSPRRGEGSEAGVAESPEPGSGSDAVFSELCGTAWDLGIPLLRSDLLGTPPRGRAETWRAQTWP